MRFLVSLSLVVLMTATSAAPSFARGGGRGGGGLVSVRAYVTSRGTYVAPHVRTRPDGVLENNLSFRGANATSPLPSGNDLPIVPPRALIESDGLKAVPTPTTWTNTGSRPVEQQCPGNRLVGTGAGFCIIN